MDKQQMIRLGDVVSVVNDNEYDPVGNGVKKYVAGGHIEPDKIHITKFGDVSNDIEIIGSAFHKLFKKDHVLYKTRFPNSGAVATFDGLCSNTTLVLKTKKDSIMIDGLLPFILHWDKFNEHITKQSVGSTNSYIRWRDLADFEFVLPTKNEQIKLHEIFWAIQNAIDDLENVIEKTKIYFISKGESLMTRGIKHVQFKKVKSFFGKYVEIPKEWEWKPVTDIFSLSSGSTPKREHPEYFTGNIPWVSSSDLNRETVYETTEKITDEGKKDARLKIYPKGTFVIAIYGLEAAGTRGKCGILGINATINQACMAFIERKKMMTEFLYMYYLLNGEKVAFNYSQGTKQQNLSNISLKFWHIPIPSIEEQCDIIHILKKIKDLISQQEHHLENLYALRKSYLNAKLTTELKNVIN